MSQEDKIYTGQLSGDAHFALNMVLAMEPGIPESILADSDPLPGRKCPGCKKTGDLRKIHGKNLMICLACFRDHRVSDFLKVFRAAFGMVFKECPRDRWLPIRNSGLEELSAFGLVDLVRDGMGGWNVSKIHFDKLEIGTVMVN